ncbi:MAG: hypothetical protein AB7Q30_22965 [Vicinamibacteria bacterium]
MAEPQVSVWIRARDAASAAFQKAERGIKSISRMALSVGRDLAAIGVGTAAAVAGISKLAQRGADMLGVQKAFNRAVGGEGVAALEQLRAATGGVVSNFDLMRKFNEGVARGMVRTTDEFVAISKAATTLSDVIGEDDTQAFETLADTLGKGNAKGLANLGIMIDQKAAADDFAKSIGRQAKDLTDLEKKEANRRAGLKEAIRLSNEMSGGELGAADAANRFAARVANLKDQISLLVAKSPTVARFFDAMKDGLNMIAGRDLADDALKASIGNLTDPRALNARFQALDAERQRIEAQQAEVGARPLRAAYRGQDRAQKRKDLAALAQQLAAVEREAELVGKRITEVASGPLKVTTQGGGGSGGGGGASSGGAPGIFSATKENLEALLDALADAQADFREKNLDAVISPSPETLKALEEARKKLVEIGNVIGPLGGLGAVRGMVALAGDVGVRSVAGPSANLPVKKDAFGRPISIADSAEKMLGPLAQRHAAQLNAEKEAAEQLANTGPVVVATLGAMGQAAIENSQITASSVIGMFTNIAQALPGVGQLSGAVIGAVGGIFSGLFNRKEKTKVHLDSVSPQAARELADANSERPYQLHATIVTPDGRTVEETEVILRNRTARDAVPRYTGPR